MDKTVAPDGLLSYKIDWSQIEKKEGKRRSFYIKLFDKDKNLLYKPYGDLSFHITKKKDPYGHVTLLAGSNLKFDESTPGMALVAIEDGGDETKVCECEARIRAYMRMLREGEGTRGEIGYTKLFGHKDFTKPPFNRDMSDHPRIHRPYGKTTSTAAGAYQVMEYTWDDKDLNMPKLRKKHRINDFSPLSQDMFCIILFKFKRPGMLNLIVKGKTEEATRKYGSYEWASLPPGRYGQPTKTIEQVLAFYNKYLKEELDGKSDLHLKKGFLKRFGISCKCKRTEKKVKEGYDIDKAVDRLITNAEPRPIGYCAKYVRLAIEAGGINTADRPAGTNAKNYDMYLPKKGFTIISSNDYTPVKGDIVVFEAFQGEKKYHKWGHIQMYTGTKWISDFEQRDFWAGPDYRKAKPPYKILRWK